MGGCGVPVKGVGVGGGVMNLPLLLTANVGISGLRSRLSLDVAAGGKMSKCTSLLALTGAAARTAAPFL